LRSGLILRITIAIIAVLVLSCENTDCISFSRDYIIVQFLDSANAKKNIQVDYITAIGSPFIFYSDTTLNLVALPLDTEQSLTTFIFAETDKNIDTLSIGYVQQQRLISETCGFELQYRNLEILATSFPEAVLQFPELNLLNNTDVKIYH
jgi:hypothetical protein